MMTPYMIKTIFRASCINRVENQSIKWIRRLHSFKSHRSPEIDGFQDTYRANQFISSNELMERLPVEISTLLKSKLLKSIPNISHKESSAKQTLDKYNSLIEQRDKELIEENSNEVVTLTIDNCMLSTLEYKKSDFHRIFKVYWVKTFSEVMPLLKQIKTIKDHCSLEYNRQLADLIHQLCICKYLNSAYMIGGFFHRQILDNNQFIDTDPRIYEDLIDFFSSRSDNYSVERVFQKMSNLGIEPTAMMFNILGKNYLSKVDIVLERIKIWLSILERMKKCQIVPDLVSWYITLSILPTELPVKKALQSTMIKSGLSHVAKFNDIKLTDMLNESESIDHMLTYYHAQRRNNLDVNCMNTIIFKYLKDGNFEDAWKFMLTESNSSDYYIKPRNSTVSIFLKDCKLKQNLEMMIRVINSMKLKFGLVNYNANRMVLNLMLKMPDGKLPDWYPLLVKSILRYDLSYGIDRYRRLDVLVKKLQYKIDANFKESMIILTSNQIKQVTDFEKIFFKNMEHLVVLEDERSIEKEKRFLLLDDDDTTQMESDYWITNVILKSYYDLMSVRIAEYK